MLKEAKEKIKEGRDAKSSVFVNAPTETAVGKDLLWGFGEFWVQLLVEPLCLMHSSPQI
jgi:hypothetical protein